MHRIFLTILSLTIVSCDSPDDEAFLDSLDEDLQAEDGNTVLPSADQQLTINPHPDAAGCQYKVIWSVAGIYEKPGWKLLKTKNAGDIVGASWCDWTWYDGVNEWLAVATASAEDGVGWIRRTAVVKY